MKKVATKKLIKKEEGLLVSCQMINKFDHYKNDQALHLKTWEEILSTIQRTMDLLIKVSEQKEKMPISELSKAFDETQTKLSRIKKETDTVQKALNKLQTEFEEKLLLPNEAHHFDTLNQETLKEFQKNMEKIKNVQEETQKNLKTIIQKTLDFIEKLSSIESVILALCVPDKMEKALELDEKLNKQLATLCEMTQSAKPANENPANAEKNHPSDLQKTFLTLYKTHREGTELLQKLQQNIGGTAELSLK